MTVQRFTSAAAFRRALQKEADELFPAFVKAYQISLGYWVYKGIAERTPVLTGRARASWTVNIGTVDRTVVDAQQLIHAPGHWFPQTGAPLSPGETAAFMRAAGVIASRPLGQVLYIGNMQHYIATLEHGTSAKAPSGMVTVTLSLLAMQGAKLPLLMTLRL